MSQPLAVDALLGQFEVGRADRADRLPDWLAQLVTALYDGQHPGTARAWVERIDAALRRLAGPVPFTVLHDWHASTVWPALAPVCPAHRPVGALHLAAAAGRLADEATWAAALQPALLAVYQRAYRYPEAYQVNYASAEEYGIANGFGVDGTREYATYYAKLATGANLRAYAEANAIASSPALAAGFAAADPQRIAQAWPYALVRAYALAAAGTGEVTAPVQSAAAAEVAGREQAAYARLADGLADSLHRAGSADDIGTF